MTSRGDAGIFWTPRINNSIAGQASTISRFSVVEFLNVYSVPDTMSLIRFEQPRPPRGRRRRRRLLHSAQIDVDVLPRSSPHAAPLRSNVLYLDLPESGNRLELGALMVCFLPTFGSIFIGGRQRFIRAALFSTDTRC